jgi:membrane protein DedA with SNARE-associated domain
MMNGAILVGLAASTFVSEDVTSIGAGLLARDGVIGFLPATAACAGGVYVGDLVLWALGRVFGRRVLRLRWVAKRVDANALVAAGARLDANLGPAVLASRFLPGSRLPMYLTVGICSQRPLAFAAWSLLAVLLWTPMLVWLAYSIGASATALLVGELNGALRYFVSVVILMALWKLAMRVMANLGARPVAR